MKKIFLYTGILGSVFFMLYVFGDMLVLYGQNKFFLKLENDYEGVLSRPDDWLYAGVYTKEKGYRIYGMLPAPWVVKDDSIISESREYHRFENIDNRNMIIEFVFFDSDSDYRRALEKKFNVVEECIDWLSANKEFHAELLPVKINNYYPLFYREKGLLILAVELAHVTRFLGYEEFQRTACSSYTTATSIRSSPTESK